MNSTEFPSNLTDIQWNPIGILYNTTDIPEIRLYPLNHWTEVSCILTDIQWNPMKSDWNLIKWNPLKSDWNPIKANWKNKIKTGCGSKNYRTGARETVQCKIISCTCPSLYNSGHKMHGIGKWTWGQTSK